jgi:hypothetical protein
MTVTDDPKGTEAFATGFDPAIPPVATVLDEPLPWTATSPTACNAAAAWA